VNKIGTEVAHVTRDSDTTFKGQLAVGILWRPPAQLISIIIIIIIIIIVVVVVVVIITILLCFNYLPSPPVIIIININYCVRGGHKPARWPWPTSPMP